jgi:hypothetical protein
MTEDPSEKDKGHFVGQLKGHPGAHAPQTARPRGKLRTTWEAAGEAALLVPPLVRPTTPGRGPEDARKTLEDDIIPRLDLCPGQGVSTGGKHPAPRRNQPPRKTTG